MGIEFDPDKDAINQGKHGVTLALAEWFDMDTAMVTYDDRAAPETVPPPKKTAGYQPVSLG